MKKILFLSLLFCLSVNIFALQIQKSYSVKAPLASVYTSTSTCVSQINQPSVKIKQLMITNGTLAQNVNIYSIPTAYSTTTVSNVMNIDVPASSVVYFPSTLATDEQVFDIPYFAVGTSTTTTPVNVTLLYRD